MQRAPCAARIARLEKLLSLLTAVIRVRTSPRKWVTKVAAVKNLTALDSVAEWR
jgi:hypothetical protein